MTNDENAEASIAVGEWSKLTTIEQSFYERSAPETVEAAKNEARVNIRMSDQDLSLVKTQTQKEGLHYQTLMSSVLQKYITGQLGLLCEL